jgi:hypothetical protein
MSGGVSLLLMGLGTIFFILLIGMNVVNSFQKKEKKKEGFANPVQSDIEVQIRTVLDELNSEELCPLYVVIRKNMAKNEKAGQNISDKEADKRVEASLALKISGGALPCPLIVYPKAGSSDLDWLAFLQKVPSDFGARIVLMAIYAQGFLEDTEKTLKETLSGNVTLPNSEGFSVCSPDVADSRRAEKKNKDETCVLPEDLSPAQIKEAVTKMLKDIVGTKTTILKSKKIDPQIDIKPILAKATKSANYIKSKTEEAQNGSLKMDAPIKIDSKKADDKKADDKKADDKKADDKKADDKKADAKKA